MNGAADLENFNVPQAVYYVPLAKTRVPHVIYSCRTYPNQLRIKFPFDLHKKLEEKLHQNMIKMHETCTKYANFTVEVMPSDFTLIIRLKLSSIIVTKHFES